VFLPENEPTRSRVAHAIANVLALQVREGRRRAMLITEINGENATRSPMSRYLTEAGFMASSLGFQMRALAGHGRNLTPAPELLDDEA
jgi:hypothetical protein